MLAGLVQASRWKARHLGCCRRAAGAGAASPSLRAAWRDGLRHGLHCCLCCAGFTLALLVTDVMDVRIMAAIAGAIALERLGPSPERVARAAGLVLVAAGGVAIVRASWGRARPSARSRPARPVRNVARVPAGGARGVRRMGRTVHPWLIRVTHWAHALLFAVMAGSGLQIYVAFPFLGPRGEPYGWVPLQGVRPPEALTIGGWLAGARHWHFAFAWLFVANALVYALYLLASGEWRRRLFLPARDALSAWQTLLHDLRLRRAPPASVGLYNGLQRLAYTGVLAVAPLVVLSGLAIYKPVQLPRLTALLGGYDAARALHLLVLVALAVFLVLHVVEVLLHPRTLLDMTAGGAKRREAAP